MFNTSVKKPSATYGFAASLACLAMLGPFAVDAYLPSFPEIAKSLGVAIFNVQQTLTWYILSFAVMNLWHGVLSDAIGRRPVVLMSLAIFACASLGCALSTNWEMLATFRFLQGASAGAGVVVAHAIVRDCFDGSVARRMVAHGALTYAIAPALAPMIGGYLTETFGWRSIFIFMALFSSGLLVWSSASLVETHPRYLRQRLTLPTILRNYREVFSQAGFYSLAAVSSLNFAAGFLYIASSSTFLMQHLGVSRQGFAWLFLPLVGGNMLGSFLSGRLAKNWPPAAAVKRSYLIMFLGAGGNLVISFLLPPQLPWSVIPLFVYAVGTAMAAPFVMLMLLDKFPKLRGTASSLRWFVQNMLLVVVAGVIAPWASRGVDTLALTMFFILLLSSIIWMAFHRHEKRLCNFAYEQY